MRSFLVAVLVAALAVPALAAPRPMPNLAEYLKLGENLCDTTGDGVPDVKVMAWSKRPLDFERLSHLSEAERKKFEWNFIYMTERIATGAAVMEWILGTEDASSNHNYAVRENARAEWVRFDEQEQWTKVANEIFTRHEREILRQGCW